MFQNHMHKCINDAKEEGGGGLGQRIIKKKKKEKITTLPKSKNGFTTLPKSTKKSHYSYKFLQFVRPEQLNVNSATDDVQLSSRLSSQCNKSNPPVDFLYVVMSSWSCGNVFLSA